MASALDISVVVTGIEEIKKALGRAFSPEMMTGVNREVGLQLQERTSDHIGRMSVKHHKSAQRLGAKPTGHFENATGRVTSKDANPNGVTISIANTPGLMMAFGSQTITPKRAKFLTIPIHREAYGKKARDLEAEGYSLFMLRRKDREEGVLMAKGKGGISFAAYALKKSVTLPHLPDLLPTKEEYAQMASETIENEIAARLANNGLK